MTLILACAGLGALIDFLLGRAGQERVRAALEAVWIHIAYIDFKTFAAAEARAASLVLRRMFGTWWSLKRVFAIICVLAASILWWCGYGLFGWRDDTYHAPFDWRTLRSLAYAIVAFSVSLSANIWLADTIARFTPQQARKRVLLYTALFLLQLALFSISYELQMAMIFTLLHDPVYRGPHEFVGIPFVSRYLTNLFNLIHFIWPSSLSDLYRADIGGGGGMVMKAITLFLYASGLVRVLLLFVFSASVLLRPLSRCVNLVIARVVESQKPVLTMAFGGMAALIEGSQNIVHEIEKLL